MVTKVGVGVCKSKKDSFKCGSVAAKQAIEKMGAKKPDFVLVFSTEDLSQEKMLKGVRSITNNTPLVGCCGAGAINNEGLSRDSLTVLTIKSDDFKITPLLGKDISKSGKRAGQELASSVIKNIKKQEGKENTVLMLPDGLTGNICDVLKGSYEILGANYKFVGGGAGDNLKFIKTHQFVNDKVFTDSIAGALFTSKSKVGIGVKHGWSPISKPIIVTKSKGNIIYEINGEPAFNAYVKQFGKGTSGLTIRNFGKFAMKYPLGISERNKEYTIRDPLRANKDGSITCVAEVPENSIIRIMKGDKDTVINAAKEAAEQAMNMMKGKKASLAVIFDCVSRLLLLGKDADKEIEAIRNVVGKDVPMIGFFTFGEIVGGIRGPPVFCNKTVVVYTLPK